MKLCALIFLAIAFAGCQFMPNEPVLKRDIENTVDRVVSDVLDDENPEPSCSKVTDATEGGDVDIALKR